ncbi:response regulator transcription factor [Naasia lichenicola]|uniref:Response regulator transcription factor n=1 Tax=Naasia lichenicola TaxID=2565933 RepID=A0A4S4FP03_9MICO|nr:response regulator transcription factor [Naasia lichenicola]THG30757.1 response regulator transcription factor [Naasia lichenicola]THG31994.1 response regulator transcription factor [Naasia lichenicola]
MPAQVHRIAVLDDHEIVSAGVASLLAGIDGAELAITARTVDELSPHIEDIDLVLLDLRLADGSQPGDNVRWLRDNGANVLVFSAGDDPDLIRSAARSGALGMVMKSAPNAAIVEAIRLAIEGSTVPSTEWAAAIDGDLQLADARLSVREKEVLAHYAAGDKAFSVAMKTGLSIDTVNNYISRIRRKYELVGRDSPSRIDLYRRAREDGLIGGEM